MADIKDLSGSDDKNLAKRSFKAASWVLAFHFGDEFFRIAIAIFLARWLLPEDFSVLGVLTVFWTVSQVFIQGGFAQALTQRKEISQTDLSTVFYYNIVLALLLCFGMIGMAPFLADFFERPILAETIKVSAWYLPISALSTTSRVLLGRQLRQAYATISHMFASIISGAVALILAYKGYGVWALVWQSFLLYSLSSIFILFYVRWIPSLVFSWKSFTGLFNYGSKLLLAGLLDKLFMNLNNVFIGKFEAKATLGFYEQARRYATLWPQSIQGSVQGVFFPAFSKIQDDLPRLRAAFKRALCASVMIVVFPSFLICALSRPFIELVLTPKWLPCLPFWYLLTCTIVFYPIHALNLELLKARGQSGKFLMLELCKKGLALVSVFVLLQFGVVAMLSFGVVSSAICAYLNSYYTGVEIHYGLFKQLKDISIYVVLSVVSCVLAWGTYAGLWNLGDLEWLATRDLTGWAWCGKLASFFNIGDGSVIEGVAYVAHWSAFILGAVVGCGSYILFNIVCKTAAFYDVLEVAGSKIKFVKKLTRR